MITEIYVPRADAAGLHGRRARTASASNGVPIIYGTIRLIEKDDESVPGVGEASRTPASSSTFTSMHTPQGVDRAAAARSAA